MQLSAGGRSLQQRWPSPAIGLQLLQPPLLLLMLMLMLAGPSWSLDNGLARRPPMGWLAWTRFTCQVDCERFPNDCISAQLFKQTAERMAEDNWLASGYEYMHIDDCWSELERDDTTQRLVADRRRFPSGLRKLADFVHNFDRLKLGLYGDCGTKTCGGYPAQLRHNDTLKTLRPPLGAASGAAGNRAELELNSHSSSSASFASSQFDEYVRSESTFFQLDAQTLAEWHVDSFKFDGCHVDPLRAETICSRMAGALAQARRPVLLICEWPFYMMYAHAAPDWELAAASCNQWRYYDDIDDSWLSILNTIDYTVKHQATILKHHGPGHWFDPDMLVIGNFGLSAGQARAQMAIWCVWAAPLFMSNDLRSIGKEFVKILQNERLIGVDQDKLGVFGQMVASADSNHLQAFVKPVLPVRNGCPSFALVYFNRKTMGNKQKVAFKVADLLLAAPIGQAAANQAQVDQYEADNASQEDEWHLGMLFQAAHRLEADLIERDQQIDPAACLERLKQAAQSGGGANSLESIEFQVEDLMDSFSETPTSVQMSGQLELLVGPNNVRAIKLTESQ